MAIDRFLHMRPRVAGQSRIEKLLQLPHIYILLFPCVALSIAVGLCYVIDANKFFQVASNYITVTSAFVIISLIVILNTLGYLKLDRFAENNPVHQDENGSYSRPTYLTNLYKTLLYLTAVCVLSHTPIALGHLAYAVRFTQGEDFEHMQTLHVYILTSYISMYVFFIIDACIILYYNESAKTWLKRKVFSRTNDISAAADVNRCNVEGIIQ